MAKKFRTAAAAFNHLLDLYEQQPGRTIGIMAEPDHSHMTPEESASLEEAVLAAAEAGVVMIERRRHEAHLIDKIRLEDAGLLFKRVGRRPRAELAPEAWTRITSAIPVKPDWLEDEGRNAVEAWSHMNSWRRFYPLEKAEEAGLALRLAAAIEAGVKPGASRRAFSAEHAGDSKALERNEIAVSEILRQAHDLSPPQEGERPLEIFGIEAFPDPILIRGSAYVGEPHRGMEFFTPYGAIPPDMAIELRINAPPPYILTIENKASFNAYVRGIRDQGLIIFTGGFPSIATMTALKTIAAQIRNAGDEVEACISREGKREINRWRSISWFHWSDIDAGGVRIFRHIENAVLTAGGFAIQPHFMGIEDAKRYGQVPKRRIYGLQSVAESDSAVAGLASWLMSKDALTVEQELIAPSGPILS